MNSDTLRCGPPDGCFDDDITIEETCDVDSFDIWEASKRADAQHAAIEHNSRGTCCLSCQMEIARQNARVGEGL